jgi:plasmid stabilization system protein ParE
VKVRFSRRSEAAIEAIGAYIAKDNPKRAVTFVRELRSKALALSKRR